MLRVPALTVKQFTGNRARVFGLISGKNLGEQFFNQAQKLLAQECEHASLPTVHALCLMFIYCGLKGTDRAGSIYRYRAFEMLKSMEIEKEFSLIQCDSKAALKKKRVISEELWGMFCFGRYACSCPI